MSSVISLVLPITSSQLEICAFKQFEEAMLIRRDILRL